MYALDGRMNACRLKHVEIFGESCEQHLSLLKYVDHIRPTTYQHLP